MRIFASALLAVLAGAAPADQPANRRDVPVLVELFTSEGCSSCPPADRVLARLLARPPDGARVIALGEHVDYWDGPGWKDRFSARVFTRRQETYTARLGLSGPYTPEMIVGGTTDLLGGDERSARRAISAAARLATGPADVRVLARDPATVTIHLQARWATPAPADVLVAFVQERASSSVTAGENAGKVLDHVAVARSLTVVGRGMGGFDRTVRLPRTAADGADRVVMIVQEPGGGPVRAVASEELGASR